MEQNTKRTILVTGFGPFRNHHVNASWEAVKELEKLCSNSIEFQNIQLITKEIPVSYDHVSEGVPKLWRDHDPIIVLHVGVSKNAGCLTLERHAHSAGYKQPDICNKCPNENNADICVVETNVNVKELCNIINESFDQTGCKACISNDPGRYLCEYIYYHSLCIEPLKTLFVHVPDLNVYTSEQTAKGLHKIVCYMIKDLTL